MNDSRLKEITKDEAKTLPEDTTYYIYNPTFPNELKSEKASRRDLAHNKYAIKELRFFIKKEEKLNEKIVRD